MRPWVGIGKLLKLRNSMTQDVIGDSGVQVKANQHLEVTPDEDHIIHLSQADLAEPDEGGIVLQDGEKVKLTVEIDGKKIVLGKFLTSKIESLVLDAVFEKKVTLSHNANQLSVNLSGYQTPLLFDDLTSSDNAADESDDNGSGNDDDDSGDDDDDEGEDEGMPDLDKEERGGEGKHAERCSEDKGKKKAKFY